MSNNRLKDHYTITEHKILQDNCHHHGMRNQYGETKPQLYFLNRPISMNRALVGGVVLLIAIIVGIVVTEDGKPIAESVQSTIVFILGLVISFAIWLKR